ncbi:zinc-binding dehydrogenase family [Podospora fimiseda]|uniref:Zinc-binding dehydrogenase family n=1 Tax=Podospora fimiseda TaxID=252190 RepID=A0AAN7GX93_9PEZI|nr:zinc-binding dehydrogenase family [Podospora fimiseda]
MPSADPIRSLPKKQTAIVAEGPSQVAIHYDAPVPFLAPDMAIVRTHAVALNPIDAKILDYSASAGAIHGHDFAGTVVALGADALKENKLQIGDRVCGFVHGMNKLRPDVGAFAQYVGATADLLLKIPDEMRFEEAAGLGMGVGTAALALWIELGIPAALEDLKGNNGDLTPGAFVFVAGGSTATGTRAIQLLQRAGLRPVTTCSPSNFDLVRRFGAEFAIDYRAPTAASDIRKYTKNELAYAFDCVTTAETTKLCYEAMGRAGGRYCAVEPFRDADIQARALTVKPSWVMALTIFGRKVAIDGEYGREATPEHHKFGAEAYAVVQELLDDGLIDPHPVKVMPGGWQGVIESIDVIRGQSVSGYKLVHLVN